jgi:uncharacterized protein (TIGR02391 family)
MQGFRHILRGSEIESGRIYISQNSENEFFREFGQIRDRAFNIFRSDNTLLLRSVVIQRTSRAGLRINFGKDTFADCVVGTPIWLCLRSDSDMEIRIGSGTSYILDAELSHECFTDLENPNSDNYWKAVNAACTILESRLRARTQASNMYGKELVNFALHFPEGKLICRSNKVEQEGIHQLCLGVMQAYRNPSLHQKQNRTRTRARQIVGIIDLLLSEIDLAEVRI